MRLEKKYNVSQWIWLFCFILHLIDKIIGLSNYEPMLPDGVTKILDIVILLLLVFRFFKFKRPNLLEKNILWILGPVLLGISTLVTRDFGLLVPILLIYTYDSEIAFKDVVRIMILEILALVLFVVLSCQVGILEDWTYQHGARVGHGFGFGYYSTIATIFMTILMGFCYLRGNKITYLELILLGILNYAMFQLHTVRTVMLIVCVLLILDLLFLKWKVNVLKYPFIKKIFIWVPLLICIVNFLLIFLYHQNVPFVKNVCNYDRNIQARMIYSIHGIETYGVHLFGKNVSMYGVSGYYHRDNPSAFYLDSSFLQLLLRSGILFTVYWIFILGFTLYTLGKNENMAGVLWLGCLLLISPLQDYILNLMYAPILLFVNSCFQELKSGGFLTRKFKDFKFVQKLTV